MAERHARVARQDSSGDTRTAAHEPFVRGLGLWDATAVVAGSMIGSGIFIVSADIARQVGAPGWLLVVWGLSALMTIIGALSYGELAAMMPHAGGQYVYLREAYGPLAGFLYGWTLFLVIQTGTIAAVAVAFAKFTAALLPAFDAMFHIGPLSVSAQQCVAIAVIAALTAANCNGLHTGRWVQNVFTVTKVGALLALILFGVLVGRNTAALQANFGDFWGTAPLSLAVLPLVGAAMVGALFSSDAWNNITFAAAEVRDPARTVPLSLMIGTSLVSGLYIAANLVYLAALPLVGQAGAATAFARGIQFASSDRVATAAVEVTLGQAGAVLMALAIMISTFGCVNGLVLAGARVYYAMAQDRLFFPAAAFLNTRRVPAAALVLQGIWAALLTLSGTYSDLLDYVIFAALLFYVLTVGAVFILRRTAPAMPRPYRAFGFPIVPAAYVGLAALIMLDLLVVKPRYTWPGLLIVASGVPVFYWWHARHSTARR
ncbi:MAG TPA: amino acid permease [Candidatus Margulisiibacteriota bacterium]|nr:amino acid permease [Candidatus Margulisiibacteriota bacterium]